MERVVERRRKLGIVGAGGDRKAAAELRPLVEGLASDVVPVINALQAEKQA